IGKIGIPDAILNKPAKLTDEEYAVMKTHTTRGAAILKDFTLLDHVVEGALYHHERYDGRGYPNGLKGEDIPLYGRIIGVADAFDAMTANRVYRKQMDFDYVLGELHRGRGAQFDPRMVDAMLKLIDDGKINLSVLYGVKPEEPKKEEPKPEQAKPEEPKPEQPQAGGCV
ncbi:MAG: HD-GYP domain-containing protein, partial [Clostridia bacterium]|nr:HD-GYP domain-containing protein [Clostridia bacterium]